MSRLSLPFSTSSTVIAHTCRALHPLIQNNNNKFIINSPLWLAKKTVVRAVSGLMLMTQRKLRDCKDIGMQSESGWKPQVWHLCAEALKGGAGGFKTAENIADRIFRCLSRLLHLMAERRASRCL